MRTRLATGLVAVSLAALALTGCSDAQDTLESAAGGLATSATSKAAAVAQQAAKQQLCRLATDTQISEGDTQGLNVAVTAAENAGVPDSITGPARTIANSGGNPPAESVAQIKAACAANP